MTGQDAQKMRHRVGKKSKDVAKQLGISRHQYSRFEAGLIGLDDRLSDKLANILRASGD